MDHRVLLQSFSLEQRRFLTEKSNLQGFAHLAAHWGAIVGTGALIVAKVPGWQFLIPVQGILIIFLFTLLHETVHDTVFKTIGVNRFVGTVCGFLLFLPAKWFRYFHFAHHRYTQNPEKDPELAGGKPTTLTAYLWYISGLPVWYAQIKSLLWNAVGRCNDSFVPAKKRRMIRNEAMLTVTLYVVTFVVCFFLGTVDLIYAWLLPLLIGQPFLRLYLLAEHGGCPYVDNMFENTRTIFTSWPVRKLAWNMPYHAEHHAYPTVPFYRLPELHKFTRDHLQVIEDGYGKFHQSFIAGLK